MKRKILPYLLMLVIAAFILAFTAGAEVVISENNLDTNGDIVAEVLVDLGNNYHMTSVDISYTDTNGQTKNGKFYYETSYYKERNQRQVKYVYIPQDFDMSQMIYFPDKVDINGNGSYESTELIKLYEGGGGFGMYTYKSYENGTFEETANAIPYIEAVSYSKYFYLFADKGFGSKAPKLTTVTYNGREPIKDTLIISPLINDIYGGSFGGDGNSLTANFIVTGIKKLFFEDREGSVSLGQYCFTRCKLEEIYFGKGTYNLNGRDRIALLFDKDYANGEGATLKTVILHKDAKIASGTISWNVGSYDVVVLGKESDSKEFYEANNQARLTCAKSVAYNPCYYGHTTEDDYICETPLVCSACDATLVEAIKHNLEVSIAYNNGYLNDGIKHEKCLNDGCNYDADLVAEALFTTNGYSTPEDGRGGIAICFNVNKKALNEYEATMNKELTYGAFAIAYNNIDDGEIFDNKKAIKTEINREFVSFEMKITGFETDEHKSAKLSLGAYVIDEKGNVSYLQSKAPNEGDTYHYITYNGIATAHI